MWFPELTRWYWQLSLTPVPGHPSVSSTLVDNEHKRYIDILEGKRIRHIQWKKYFEKETKY